jgi:hypothetical protein
MYCQHAFITRFKPVCLDVPSEWAAVEIDRSVKLIIDPGEFA